ncbi:uncharacterized protein RB166_017405 [Leptodactylus fuscus]
MTETKHRAQESFYKNVKFHQGDEDKMITNTKEIAEPRGTGAQQPTQRPQTRQDGGSGRTSSGNAWSRGAPSFASNSNYTGQAFRRRNVVRFRHGGAKEDLPDRRFVVRELLCTQMGFVPTDILAVINLPDRQGYDVSFKLMSDLDRFWANLTRLRDTEGWDKFSFIPISRPDTASVTIVFWNEAVPPQDIVIWLRRHCDLMSDLTKNRDEDGVWTGGWRVLVKLRQQNNITQHLPNSFFIGREKGICFYAGQPRRCFKCGKAGHVASVCSMVKCSLCNEMGHVSATCQNIRCNLCGRIGHPHRDCPDAWHNICKDSPDEDLLAAADDIQEEEEALLSGIKGVFSSFMKYPPLKLYLNYIWTGHGAAGGEEEALLSPFISMIDYTKPSTTFNSQQVQLGWGRDRDPNFGEKK